jgi:membrane protease YdiL (CAAX protease family)
MSIFSPDRPESPVRRSYPLLAWVVIIAAVVFLVWRSQIRRGEDRREIDLVLVEMQARLQVGFASLFPEQAGLLYEQVKNTLDRGSYSQRVRFAVLAGELAGPAEALKQLGHLQDEAQVDGEPSEPQAQVTRLLVRLYAGYEKEAEDGEALRPVLSGPEQAELRRPLRWFGDLALAPAGGPDAAARARVLAPAKRAAAVYGAVFGIGLLGAFAGMTLLVVFGALGIAGRLRDGLAGGPAYGGIYAETFALYLVLFPALGLALSRVPAGPAPLLVSGLAPLLSLAALAWPVLRGVPWRRVRQDIGWTAGREPALEPLAGLGCYLAALFLVAVVLVYYYFLMRLGLWHGPSPDETPAHPIVAYLARAGWWGWLQALVVAGIIAPVVEETMFRGVLYRHLREAGGRVGRVGSVLASALVVSFVFAVIHPYGLVGVPVLMALAFAFALAREWRGTLIPSMVAHGIHNSLLTLLFVLIMS